MQNQSPKVGGLERGRTCGMRRWLGDRTAAPQAPQHSPHPALSQQPEVAGSIPIIPVGDVSVSAKNMYFSKPQQAHGCRSSTRALEMQYYQLYTPMGCKQYRMETVFR